MNHILTLELLTAYARHLHSEDKSSATVEKYLFTVRSFLTWLAGRPVTREDTAAYREHLAARYAPATVNAAVAALNSLFHFLGWSDCRMKYLKIQRLAFREKRRELTKAEYGRLIETARQRGQERLALIMEAICATGIRVSEVRYLTMEAAQEGRATVRLKGKIRTILLPGKLCRKLIKYAKAKRIRSGEIFLTGSGRSLGRGQIWAEMKRLCRDSGVEASKVFPHNLRHLFATAFYQATRDIVKLADVLGHSSVETTRIYLATSGTEHARLLERLGLVA